MNKKTRNLVTENISNSDSFSGAICEQFNKGLKGVIKAKTKKITRLNEPASCTTAWGMIPNSFVFRTEEHSSGHLLRLMALDLLPKKCKEK